MNNIANWSGEKREALAADLAACKIRHECKGLGVGERQRLARERLDKMEPEFRAQVIEAMRKRAK